MGNIIQKKNVIFPCEDSISMQEQKQKNCSSPTALQRSFSSIEELKQDDNNPETKLKIIVKKNQIVYLSPNACKVTGYTSEIVKNIRIHQIVPHIYGLFIEELIANGKIDIKKIEHIRKLPIKKIDKTLLWIENISYIRQNNDTHIYFHVSEAPIVSPNIPKEFKYKLSYEPEFRVIDYDNCYITLIDIFNSTSLTITRRPKEVALFYHDLLKILLDIINRKYYPCIQLIECVGDSFLLCSNPRYSFECNKRILMIMNLLTEFNKKISPIMDNYNCHIRCGVSYGECCGGVWDGKTFRLAGKVINLAARLESQSPKGYALISTDCVYNDDIHKMLKNHIIEEGCMMLKGFPDPCCYYKVKL